MKTSHNKSGVVIAPGQFEIQDRSAITEVPDGWVLVDIAAVGICGTDYHIFQGHHPFLEYPRVIGHELSGHVHRDSCGFATGELVVVNPYLSCGTCRACLRGKPNCCYNIEVLGVHRDGGMTGQIAVPSENLYPAKGLSVTEAAMVEFLAIGAHAVRRSETGHGDRVLVTGAGPIGLGTALFARLVGAEVHMLDISAARLAIVADTFGLSDTHLTVADAVSHTGGEGFDAVFDATGNAKAIEAGFPALAHGGTYTLVSVVKDNITFNDPEFHKREMRLVGSRNALKEDFEWVMEMFRQQKINADDLCSCTLTIEEFADRFSELAQNRDSLIKAILRIEA